MIAPGFTTSNPRRIGKGLLIGCVDLELPSGMIIRGVMLMESAGKRWINLPSKEWTNREGLKRCLPLLEFSTPEVRERFQAEVLPLVEDALR
jgi:hypothetical protein